MPPPPTTFNTFGNQTLVTTPGQPMTTYQPVWEIGIAVVARRNRVMAPTCRCRGQQAGTERMCRHAQPNVSIRPTPGY
jgi:hypothetical protein